MAVKQRIGILLIGLADEYCGGAERFFADFYDHYHLQKDQSKELFFITDQKSFSIYNEKLNKLSFKKNVIIITEANNRFKTIIDNLSLFYKIFVKKIDIIHVASYDIQYYKRVKFISSLPSFLRPKIVVNIVDAQVPIMYPDPSSERYKKYRLRYESLFKNIRVDAYYSWYLLFKKWGDADKPFSHIPYIEAIKTRFCDTQRFFPAKDKQNYIVFAARLIEEKKPLWFLRAVDFLKQENQSILAGWKFFIYGKGPLEKKISEEIDKCKLSDIVVLSSTSDMANVFAKSKCFVSTQDYENFPSLSMCEAMSSGNAIISRNVGQTDFFVKHMQNGLLLESDSPEGLAEALRFFITNPQLYESMSRESIRLTKEVHTPENFIKDIDKFWSRFA